MYSQAPEETKIVIVVVKRDDFSCVSNPIRQPTKSDFINLICSKTLMKMFFDQPKMPSSYLTIRDVMSSEKAFLQLLSSSCVSVLARPLIKKHKARRHIGPGQSALFCTAANLAKLPHQLAMAVGGPQCV